MVTINNSDLNKEYRDVTAAQIGNENVPNQVVGQILPVIDINPKHARIINKVIRGTAAGTTYTTPADKDFYLVATHLNVVSTAAGTNTITLQVVPKGGAAVIINDIYQLATAAVDAVSSVSNIPLPIPILLERNSAITTAVTGTTASRSVIIYGYEVENINA